MAVKILLADDHNVMRQGLRELLKQIPLVEVVEEARTGAEAVKLASRLNPDLVLMDVTMPDLNGIEATRRIVRECKGTKVVALSMQTDRNYIMGMLRAGASGYLLKDCSLEELAKAIQKVAGGGSFLSSSVSDAVVEELRSPGGPGADSSEGTLTSREREILQLIAEAKRSKEIAELLHISLKTVYTHRRNIMEKLGAKNLADLTRYALKEGLTSLSSR